ncbi:MAG: hypothetical protein KKA99_04030 [Gammaproteobacteria bacterium]|nr:hypothetical protein [Gammaproteobacteria bacterium]MBU1558560.1 hypothetical protein [Gammaproteobacteria bacterium]MBU1628756.1 hypothetical protein [Gammaproteobacteria bacterium]MBU1926713.1 hypothetical protein [Gammaproteobacteria bacterium]MBU2546495.1 hypothetical protein [Gammaproteobacteria bacterium]
MRKIFVVLLFITLPCFAAADLQSLNWQLSDGSPVYTYGFSLPGTSYADVQIANNNTANNASANNPVQISYPDPKTEQAVTITLGKFSACSFYVQGHGYITIRPVNTGAYSWGLLEIDQHSTQLNSF